MDGSEHQQEADGRQERTRLSGGESAEQVERKSCLCAVAALYLHINVLSLISHI